MSAGEKAAVATKRRRCRFQFSLGSMLLVMTVFGVWLGIRMDRARRQEQAVQALRQHGDVVYERVFFDSNNTKRFPKRSRYQLKWLRGILGDDFFDRVSTVYLYDTTTDDDLKCVADLPDVESLILSSEEVTDEGLMNLRHLHSLKELLLGCPKVTDTGLSTLSSLSELNYLSLLCSATDDGIHHLQLLRELRSLAIAFPVSDEGILALEPLENLEELSISESSMSSVCRQAVHELDNPTQPQTFDVPLSSVCDYLMDLHGVPFTIDAEAMQAAGITVDDVAITTQIAKQSLPSALSAILEGTGLDWILTQEGIVITTGEKAAERLAAVRELRRHLPNLKRVTCVVEP